MKAVQFQFFSSSSYSFSVLRLRLLAPTSYNTFASSEVHSGEHKVLADPAAWGGDSSSAPVCETRPGAPSCFC